MHRTWCRVPMWSGCRPLASKPIAGVSYPIVPYRYESLQQAFDVVSRPPFAGPGRAPLFHGSMTLMPSLSPVRRRLQPLLARGIPALLAVFALSVGRAAAQQDKVPPANPPDTTKAADTTAAADTTSKPLTAQQLQSMVAPIALYPDDLLAQTLVASTYPLEIVQLQQWMAKNPNLKDKALA